jgi:hypothetical protein
MNTMDIVAVKASASHRMKRQKNRKKPINICHFKEITFTLYLVVAS